MSELDQIEARLKAATPGAITITPSDIDYLLTLARKQAAALEAIAELTDGWEMNAGPGTRAAEVFGPQQVSVEFAVRSIRAALKATK